MRLRSLPLLIGATLLTSLSACGSSEEAAPTAGKRTASDIPTPLTEAKDSGDVDAVNAYLKAHRGDYVKVPLTADLDGLNDKQKRMIGLLIKASRQMDTIYWQQGWGQQASLASHINMLGLENDKPLLRLASINYGPWDRLNEDHPFVPGIGPRPPGGGFYPADISKTEFEAAALDDKRGLYTLVRRTPAGQLYTQPYRDAYAGPLRSAAKLLRQASSLAEDPTFRNYLKLRANALTSDRYQPSDLAWMDMKDNRFDLVIGPIETYDDQLFGYKAAYEAYVLIKDMAWSERLARFAKYLPELQRGLPVPDKYKAETPGSDADLNAYDAVFYAGNANVGAKTIAINLPNDEEVQLKKGTRRLQLKNVMQAKFDKIMLPIAAELIADDQLGNVTFDAFFQNTMFHEVAHGLGIKNTLDGKGTVSHALKEYASNFEEGKADVLGLYMVTQLAEKGELDRAKLMDNYVTFLAGIFRSVRFGASDAHGKANMIRFNYFQQRGAFTRDDATGRYRVDFDKMTEAMNALSADLLTIQGDGDYARARTMTDTLGTIDSVLSTDLKRLGDAGIPIDVLFDQGPKVLGLTGR
ncbi:MAG: Zn-dependent hydrolase [Xanthomonadales bacterium]|nr:Zn-dependent hydrolase [Xanthomonadales bacterium]